MGGNSNEVSGLAGFIGGGVHNDALGERSGAIAGNGLIAQGDFSFLGGGRITRLIHSQRPYSGTMLPIIRLDLPVPL